MSQPDFTRISVPQSSVATTAEPRDLETVPFVELADGRLQGVVSSGSDQERVYCAFVDAGTFGYYSSTNNNRPDAGTVKRITWLVEAAMAQYGTKRVISYLKLPLDPAKVKKPANIVDEIARRGALRKENAGLVFARFLSYLRYVEFQSPAGPVPEMAWFVG